MSDILQRILEHKRTEVEARRRQYPLAELRARARDSAPTLGFEAALRARIAGGAAAVIAECKRASPSKGLLREPYDPAAIATGYAAAGASAISVLTDVAFFQGADQHLRVVRSATVVPLLRKDFVVDAYQIVEARVLGADAVLLIVAALSDEQLQDLAGRAREYGLDVLVEVHDEAELERALTLDCPLIGVNNRDLRSFQTTLATSLRLRPAIPPDRIMVSESGIHHPDDVARLRAAGIHAFLVGEAFMRAPDPGAALRALFAPAPLSPG